MKVLVVIFTLGSFVFTACNSSKNKEGIAISYHETPEAKAAKTNTIINEDTSLVPLKLTGKWELETVLKDSLVIKPALHYYIQFLNNGVSFNIDCNNCFTSKVEISSTRINIGPAACTKKACSPSFNELRGKLYYVGNYTVNDSSLTILSDKGANIKFKKISIK